MKKGIFNAYVKYVCKGLEIKKSDLFKKNREEKISNARWVLWLMCYQRPMSIIQIVDLMSEKGYVTSRGTIKHGINKASNYTDPDLIEFISKGIESYNHDKAL